MSRSTRHTPIIGITKCVSEADDKKLWHGRFRTRERDNLLCCRDWDRYVTTHFRAVSNPWSMGKDGRKRMDLVSHPHLKRYMRK